MSRARWLVPLAAWAWLAAGCDLFKPAAPEPPAGDVLIGDYSDPEATLETIADAIAAKGQLDGLNVYLQGFLDPATDGRSFSAEFDPATVSEYQGQGGTVPAWGRSEESNFYVRVSSLDNDRRLLTWSESQLLGNPSEPPTDSVVVLNRRYELFRVTPQNSLVHIAYGHAILRIVRIGPRWAIQRWTDREDPAPPGDVPSYGMLRLQNQ